MSISTKPRCCPFCDARTIIKKGTRQNQYRLVQLYRCTSCWKYFTPLDLNNTTYPPALMLRAISLYNLGHSQAAVARLLLSKHHVRVPRRTISQWITTYAPVCSYARLRPQGKALYAPEQLIRSQTLTHSQVYAFKLHRAKLHLLTDDLPPTTLSRLHQYLLSVGDSTYPHALFQPKDNLIQSLHRSSQLTFDTLPFLRAEKQNRANDLAALGLMLAKRNTERHPCIQDFMIINDSVTVACEVPVYLTQEDVAYFGQHGFSDPLNNSPTPITGHIDFIQVRGGLIYILDYKPDAHKITPIHQLITYALALSSRTKLPLKLFKCAWFDDKHYYEFFPLQAVYPKRSDHD